MNIFPILIPSKGRPDSKLFQQLEDEGLEYFVFVEPQDCNAYKVRVPKHKLIVIPLNNQGLWYARQEALTFARDRALKWFWMADDDIKSFVIASKQRNVTVGARTAIEEAQKNFETRGDIGIASMNFQQYCWSATKRLSFGKMCDNFVAINVPLTKAIDYRKMDLKVDRDFTLQVLSLGLKSVVINYVGYTCPKEGSNQGGLYEVYNTPGVEENASKNMIKLWGSNICKFNLKKDGRPDVKYDTSSLCN